MILLVQLVMVVWNWRSQWVQAKLGIMQVDIYFYEHRELNARITASHFDFGGSLV
jgi:hypothetical protein